MTRATRRRLRQIQNEALGWLELALWAAVIGFGLYSVMIVGRIVL